MSKCPVLVHFLPSYIVNWAGCSGAVDRALKKVSGIPSISFLSPVSLLLSLPLPIRSWGGV